ncbi:hypothetical protein [Nannocystis sp.]|uniref:hypothetical protein n=1 Tax=Nannocystis sp. TaxID=1962667 RepID=UPI0025DDACCF|nr:hypothetical protein [Nannocystis sp.]MBK7825325.1 hypothetical protein [Nannocystis sp.]
MRAIFQFLVCFVAAGNGLAVGACTSETGSMPVLEPYFEARDARTSTFCGCFHELVGSGDPVACEEAQALTGAQKGCIGGIFDDHPADQYTYYSAPLECLAAVESDYAACLHPLGCEDFDGLDVCVKAYNEAVLDCPRLSEHDTEDFEQCMLL